MTSPASHGSAQHTKVWTHEFKQQAVQLAQQPGNTNQGIASDLGISQSALSSWIKAAKEHGSLAFPGQGIARLTPEQETIKRLERENEILRQERSILKAAAVWFAKEATLLANSARTKKGRTIGHEPASRSER